MLDQETKKRIDDARDILVGKVPDPKSQVEQITIALIYKFMDDMDKEAEEWGGKATFFSGDFTKYAWSKIFDPKLGGFDLLNLYSEAIIKMSQNKNIPQLFRDIFKNAFLPYRDPETLKSFLKIINDFTYDHSERLGDAFEYLLSVLGSQGDAGQFRTPRHIIDFMVKVIDPQKNETVLDPACGTAGFLISSYKHILQQNTKDRLGDQLTPDDRKRLMNNFVGYDISPDMVRLSLVNMYLHGFQTPKVQEYDTLTSEEKWDETYDVILANPPFMTPKGGIRPHKRFSIKANRSEVLFVDYIAEHLAIEGKAAVIVPEGIIFQSANAYRALRKMLIESNYLYAVVSLPAGVFNPYANVKTSILFMDKSIAKKVNNILFVKLNNDGFDLGAQRKQKDENDIPVALDMLIKYKKAVLEGKDIIINDCEKEIAHIVSKDKIIHNKDYSLSGDRYKEITIVVKKDFQMVPIEEVVVVNPSKAELKKLDQETDVSFVPMSDLSQNNKSFEIKEKRKLREVINGYTHFTNDDVLLAKITPCFENGKSGIAKNLTNNIGFGSTEFIVLRPTAAVLPEWIYYCISNERFINFGKKNMTGSAGQQRVPLEFVKSFKIPIAELSVQRQIIDEIEVYQQIIDGARKVIDNYKPVITVDQSWDTVELGEIVEVKGGKRIPKGLSFAKEKTVHPYIRVVDFRDNSIDMTDLKYIDDEVYEKIKAYTISYKDIYISIAGTIGLVGQIPEVLEGANLTENAAKLMIKDENMLYDKFLVLVLSTEFSKKQIEKFTHAVGVPKLALERIKQVIVPIPPLEIQKQVVSKIEEEQKLVAANVKIIELFNTKIRSKLSAVWE